MSWEVSRNRTDGRRRDCGGDGVQCEEARVFLFFMTPRAVEDFICGDWAGRWP